MSDPCCDSEEDKGEKARPWRFDPVFHGSLFVILASVALYYAGFDLPYIAPFVQGELELMHKMWWGVVLGIIFVGLMSEIPREYFRAVLGHGGTLGGIIRAAIAGLFLDLCSHGILLIGAKLYERGASIAQVMTFLIASPWNSLSLTIILIALIGFKWTLIYIAGSALIAVLTGLVYQALIRAEKLPANPNKTELPEDFSLLEDAKTRLKSFKLTAGFFRDVAANGYKEGKMILKWLLFGLIIAAAIRAFVPTEIFEHWFGPSIVGLLLTLLATTIIEVCSEGSAPIASELVTRAGAPGNGFAFLMAGVATDYTEIMVLREFTKSWKITLFLPLITVPQVLVLGYIMNVMGS